jgi:hypothetical protein
LDLVKDNKLDIELLKKLIDSTVKDDFWKPVLKGSVDFCIKKVSDEKEKFDLEFEKAPFNIKKGECNTSYMLIATCVFMESFKV